MQPLAQTVLLFGDQSDAFAESIDFICKQAEHQPWLRSFLADTSSVLRDETRHWEQALRESLGTFYTIQELSDQFRHQGDDVGMAHGLLVFIMRQSLLLQSTRREPVVIGRLQTISVCGGYLNAAALEVATDFDTLYEASLEMLRVLCRLERLVYDRARAIDLSKGSWSCAVTGITAEKLQIALDNFQNAMEIPETKRVRIAMVGQGWSTIIGSPTVLKRVLQQCTAVKLLPKQDLNIRGPFHIMRLSNAEFDEVLGSSSLLDLPAGSVSWKSVVKSACEHVLTRPFNVAEAVKDLNSRLGSVEEVDLNIIGPSSHANSIANQLKAIGKQVTVRHEHLASLSLPRSPSNTRGKIAIIGMAGQGPGADNLSDFWRINLTGRDLHKRIPKDRFDIQEFFSATHDSFCSTSAQFGCFIDRPGAFDARFFNISHREALLMEPCHRLWLVSVYEALEMAGYSQDRTRQTDPNRIGVFFGQSVSDWKATTHHRGCNSYDLQGVQRAFGPGRVNYHFKWEGPSYNIDSACASSASAITLACQNLLSGEVDMAVAGGANAISSPHAFSELSRAGVLSLTGNCKTYRDDADGYCRGEFSDAVVLKRVEDAITANDNILAVIAASARNSSGNASSITSSDAGAQQRLFRQVLCKACVAPEEVAYIEMHGTGTQVGDLAEMTAVINTFKRPNGDEEPLRVGALKANIGHSEGAAGVASLLKCVLALQKELIPPVANMPHKLNPNFPNLRSSNVEIPAHSVEFKACKDKKRRIVLNNFDAAGGITCLLIEDFAKGPPKSADPRSCHVVTMSAKSASSLTEGKKKLLNFLHAGADDHLIGDLAYTTTARRTHYPFRTAIAASSVREVVDKLGADIKSNTIVARVTAPPIVFMFTGQGSDYGGMGAAFTDFLISDIITNPSIDLSTKTTTQTQLAIVCLEIALASFWQANGIEPGLVMGHSLGEYAALYVADVLSLTDVLLLVGRRSQLVLDRCEQYACSMLSVVSSWDNVTEYLRSEPSCEIACINSPKATVISGPVEGINRLQEELEKDGIRSHKLSMPYAFHSGQIDSVLDDYATLARSVTYFPPKVPIASTLLGTVIGKQGIVNETYLVRQMREKVDYVGGLHAAIQKLEDPLFLEIGPRRGLGGFVQATLNSTTPVKILSTLDGTNEEWNSVSKTMALLYSAGVEIDWTAFHRPYTKHMKLISLPTYSWDLKDYWLKWTEPREGRTTVPTIEHAKPEVTEPISSMLHFVETQSLFPSLRFTFRSSANHPYLRALVKGHRLRTVPVCPGGVYCEIGMEAVKYALEARGQKRPDCVILNASFNRPFTMLQDESTAEIITTITMPNKEMLLATFAVRSPSNTYIVGQCHVKVVDKSTLQFEWDRTSYFIKARIDGVVRAAMCGEGHRFKSDVFYSIFSRCLDYDAAYKGIKEAYLSTDFSEAVAEVILQEDPSGPRSFSAYWNDSLVHLAGFVANANPFRSLKSTLVTNGFDESKQTGTLHPGAKYLSYVRTTKSEADAFSCDVFVFDSADKLVMQCSNLQFRRVDNISLERILGRIDPAPVTKAKNITSKKIDTSVPKLTPQKVDAAPCKSEIVLDTLLSSIAIETGTDVAELTDDAVVSELGLDSIMAMQVVATVRNNTGVEISSSFIFQYPTIGGLRKELAGAGILGMKATELEVEEAGEGAPPAASQDELASSSVLTSLLRGISAETGSEMQDLTDDAVLAELGCDSIMALQLASTVRKETGYDLQGSFVVECPRIGDIRQAFGNLGDSRSPPTSQSTPTFRSTPASASTPISTPSALSLRQEYADSTRATDFAQESNFMSGVLSPRPIEKAAVAIDSDMLSDNLLNQESSVVSLGNKDEDPELMDFASIPEAKIILMQGKRSSNETPLFLMADGFGTAATYIHLPRFKSGLPIYAIESAFLRCPGKVGKAGIHAIARFAVDAIIKARPRGPYLLGGFSGGATISYEICRQLAATGRKLQGLLLIDMCCPREMDESTDAMATQGLPLVQRLLLPTQPSALTSNHRAKFGPLHLKQVVRAVCHYSPPPLAPSDRPARVCIIWAQKGLIERARSDSQALSILADMSLQTEVAEGFMTDPTLGPAAWSVPSKSGADLGPNGWDMFLGDDIKVLVADADHLSMPVPPDVSCPQLLLSIHQANSIMGY